jgi:DNA repair protein RadC
MTIPEYKCVVLRESSLTLFDSTLTTPENAFEFFGNNIKDSVRFTPGVENFCVIHLNTRRRVTGWQVMSTGTLDTILVHPREVFRSAVIGGAAAIILLHNHPSGDPTPSEADVKVTRDLIRAGQIIKIEVLDHLIVGDFLLPGTSKQYTSLRELGYFYS